MKTVLLTGGDVPLPDALREVVERGSTTVIERRAADVARGGPPAAAIEGVDRLVFWSAGADAALRGLAERFARAEARAGRELLVFVTAENEAAERPAGLTPNELYVWPRDEDRLKMAFLTGA